MTARGPLMPASGSPAPAGVVVRAGPWALRGLFVALPLLGGCAGLGAPVPSAVLPPDAVEGAGDPTRMASGAGPPALRRAFRPAPGGWRDDLAILHHRMRDADRVDLAERRRRWPATA